MEEPNQDLGFLNLLDLNRPLEFVEPTTETVSGILIPVLNPTVLTENILAPTPKTTTILLSTKSTTESTTLTQPPPTTTTPRTAPFLIPVFKPSPVFFIPETPSPPPPPIFIPEASVAPAPETTTLKLSPFKSTTESTTLTQPPPTTTHRTEPFLIPVINPSPIIPETPPEPPITLPEPEGLPIPDTSTHMFSTSTSATESTTLTSSSSSRSVPATAPILIPVVSPTAETGPPPIPPSPPAFIPAPIGPDELLPPKTSDNSTNMMQQFQTSGVFQMEVNSTVSSLIYRTSNSSVSVEGSDTVTDLYLANSPAIVGGEVYQLLCGVPGVCKASATLNCRNITLSDCQDCSSTGTGFFVFFAVCLALAILLGNSLIISVSVHLSRKRKSTKIDGYKASLAVADLIMGFLILFVTLPNFAWAANLTFDEIPPQLFLLRNTATSIFGGTMYLFSFTSSLYHLVLFGMTRLYAIKWPYQYRNQSKRNFRIGIFVVWILAAAVSSVPAWFPNLFDYDYYHIVFLYLPSVTVTEANPFSDTASAMLILLVLVPYVLMTVIMIATAILVRTQVQLNRKRVTAQDDSSTFTKQEISAFKTVAVMQLGFTLTLVPVAVAVGLLTSGYFGCDDLSTPYLVCLYLSMTNSLVNVLVYSIRDKTFRSAVRDMLKHLKTTLCQEDFLQIRDSSQEMQMVEKAKSTSATTATHCNTNSSNT